MRRDLDLGMSETFAGSAGCNYSDVRRFGREVKVGPCEPRGRSDVPESPECGSMTKSRGVFDRGANWECEAGGRVSRQVSGK